jgi:hypothetical protein
VALSVLVVGLDVGAAGRRRGWCGVVHVGASGVRSKNASSLEVLLFWDGRGKLFGSVSSWFGG